MQKQLENSFYSLKLKKGLISKIMNNFGTISDYIGSLAKLIQS